MNEIKINTFVFRFLNIVWILYVYFMTPIRSFHKYVKYTSKYINKTPSFTHLMKNYLPSSISQSFSKITSFSVRSSIFNFNDEIPKPPIFIPKTISIHQPPTIYDIKNKDIYRTNHTNVFKKNPKWLNKQIIAISPGGYKGFYIMGMIAFLKDHYDLSDFIFTGASAGSWNSLFACLRTTAQNTNQNTNQNTKQYSNDSISNMLYFPDSPQEKSPFDDKRTTLNMLNILVTEDVKNAKSIKEMEQTIKKNLLSTYTEEDFDLSKLFIGVTHFHHPLQSETVIYGNFENLEDAIDCCIASSNIPLITGSLFHEYRNRTVYDGGFRKNPYLFLENNPILHITPSMWKRGKIDYHLSCSHLFSNWGLLDPHFIHVLFKIVFERLTEIIEFTTLFSKDKYDFLKLYSEGYRDAKENREYLDTIFLKPTENEFPNEDESVGGFKSSQV